MFRRSTFRPGDRVVFEKDKHSTSPGPRAREIRPETNGEGYYYRVDKYWIVTGIRDDGRLILETRRGKRHIIEPDHKNLRHASFFEKWMHGDRFPDPAEHTGTASNTG